MERRSKYRRKRWFPDHAEFVRRGPDAERASHPNETFRAQGRWTRKKGPAVSRRALLSSSCRQSYAASGLDIFSTATVTRAWIGSMVSVATLRASSDSLVVSARVLSTAVLANSLCTSIT